MSRATILQPPELDIDKALGYGRGPHDKHLSVDAKLERRIVWNLLAYLRDAGFRPTAVYSPEDAGANQHGHAPAHSAKVTMELVFALDSTTISFGDGSFGVFLVLGNGIDVISDWTAEGDFGKAMEAFDAEVYA